ncbi:MAG: glycosyltransferase family 2 protein [Burkholderiaceae bacterium]
MYSDRAILVSVCVCTYRRTELLIGLLESLVAQTLPHENFEVIVVENDQAAAAQNEVKRFAAAHPSLCVRYAVEPQQGISFARNRTVNMASGEYLAFIDDDEAAAPAWLAHMLDCLHQFGSDAVFGPVIPVFPPGTPAWIVQSHFFDRQRYQTGTTLGWGDGRTCNALVTTSMARKRLPVTFEPRLARSGGEDTDFFKWLTGQGGLMTWCDDAIVSELVPAQRQTLRYILARSLRSSVVFWRETYAGRTASWRYKRALVGLVGACLFGLAGLAAFPLGLGPVARAWSRSMKLLGRAAALGRGEYVGYGGTV